ncbi:unnamed protein product [Rhizoctonia solani]|uniref:30S ribosomal protein S15 n=1 Tax=Rhizoctonia solani TaxID=456999 RepID=A0A8H2X3B1_9AGAM|nr:unnamed protein product [Rhizoctonia solani]
MHISGTATNCLILHLPQPRAIVVFWTMIPSLATHSQLIRGLPFRVLVAAPSAFWGCKLLAPLVLVRSFHLTAPLGESYKSRKARAEKRKNLETQQKKKQGASAARPNPVLGHSNTPEGRKLWENSDLCNILLTEAKILSTPPEDLRVVSNTIPYPANLNFGIKSLEKELVFQALPEVAAQQAFYQATKAPYDAGLSLHVVALQQAESRATVNAVHLSRLADLRNASAAGIAVENRRRCVEAFSLPDKPNDTGRPEVQAAILTAQIRNLAAHLEKQTHDIHNRRSIRMLVHKRAKILKYLKQLDLTRYEAVLPRLGLEAAAIEGELIVK